MQKLVMTLLMVHLSCVLSLAEDVAISVDFYPAGSVSGQGNPVTLSLKGKNYPDSTWYSGSSDARLSEDENFILTVVAINANGSLEDFLSLWKPDEVSRIRKIFEDDTLFRKNQSYYKNVKGTAFLSKVYYGDFTIFIVQHYLANTDSIVKEYPIVKINGKYYLSNKLSDDPVFMYLTDKYAKSLPRKQFK